MVCWNTTDMLIREAVPRLMVTLDDVAARAGVSRMTASNAMRGKSVVKASTARKVLAAAAELGYRPNLAARQLSSGRTHIIGVSVADLDFIFPAALAAELSDQAFKLGYQLIAQQTRMSASYEHAMMNSASAQVCDGTIVCWPSEEADSMVEFSRSHPTVVMDGFGLEDRVDSVFTPCEAGAHAAVKHLVEQAGARRVLVLGAEYRSADELAAGAETSPALRLRGAASALTEAGLAYEPDNVYRCGWTRESGYQAMARILEERREARGTESAPSSCDFDAVFCLTDPIAIGALKALTDVGVRVPEDVAIIGFDGVEDGKYTNPGLSSVVIDTKEVAESCLNLLISRIEAVHGTAHEELPPRTRTLNYRIAARGSAERR